MDHTTFCEYLAPFERMPQYRYWIVQFFSTIFESNQDNRHINEEFWLKKLNHF